MILLRKGQKVSITRRNHELMEVYYKSEGVELWNVINLIMKNNESVITKLAQRNGLGNYIEDYLSEVKEILYTYKTKFIPEKCSNFFHWILTTCQRARNRVSEQVGAMKVARTGTPVYRFDRKSNQLRHVGLRDVKRDYDIANTSLNQLNSFETERIEYIKIYDNELDSIDYALDEIFEDKEELFIIKMRFVEKMTLKDIGLCLGVSHERIRKNIIQILDKNSVALKEYLRN